VFKLGAVALIAPKRGDFLVCSVRKSGELKLFPAKNGTVLVSDFDRPHLAVKWSW
jgi:hypothetical protein